MPPKTDRQKQMDKLVGQCLRDARKKAGLSLNEVAAILLVTRQQVSMYEKGYSTCPASSLYLLARLAGTTTDFLFSDLQKALDTCNQPLHTNSETQVSK